MARTRKADEHARDQFAALGLFIQNFENIVSALRNHCTSMTIGGQRGILIDTVFPINLLIQHNICSLIFHHEAITARPLLDLWRALIFEQSRALPTLSVKGNLVLGGVVRQLAREFQELIDTRNRLIHATWGIGRWIPGVHDFDALMVEKYKVGIDGFTRRDDLPQSHNKLMEKSIEAVRFLQILSRFIQLYHWEPNNLEKIFLKEGKKWVITPSAVEKRASP
jgi:hypothetical protein